MPYTPILATLGYVLSPDGRDVLLVHRHRRPQDAHLGKYNGLGGKLDPGETSQFESAVADAKKALEAGGTENMNQAAERLQQAAHKLAEAMYRSASSQGQGPSPSGEAPPPGAAPSGKEDEVIDTEYVDSEKK